MMEVEQSARSRPDARSTLARPSEVPCLVEQQNRMYPVASDLPFDPSDSLDQSSDTSDSIGCCFSTDQVLEGVTTH